MSTPKDKRKPETIIRELRSLLADARRQMQERYQTSEHYRARATRAEQEVAEWKARFDALLVRTPPAPHEKEGGR